MRRLIAGLSPSLSVEDESRVFEASFLIIPSDRLASRFLPLSLCGSYLRQGIKSGSQAEQTATPLPIEGYRVTQADSFTPSLAAREWEDEKKEVIMW